MKKPVLASTSSTASLVTTTTSVQSDTAKGGQCRPSPGTSSRQNSLALMASSSCTPQQQTSSTSNTSMSTLAALAGYGKKHLLTFGLDLWSNNYKYCF
jgi:hypothetical protein